MNKNSFYCKHGHFIGGPLGPDYICGLCESGADILVKVPCWKIYLTPDPDKEGQLYKTVYSIEGLKTTNPLFGIADNAGKYSMVTLEIALEQIWVAEADFDDAPTLGEIMVKVEPEETFEFMNIDPDYPDNPEPELPDWMKDETEYCPRCGDPDYKLVDCRCTIDADRDIDEFDPGYYDEIETPQDSDFDYWGNPWAPGQIELQNRDNNPIFADPFARPDWDGDPNEY